MFGSQIASRASRLVVRRFRLPVSVRSFAHGVVTADRTPRLGRQAPPVHLSIQPSGGTRTVRIVNWNLLHARRDNDRRLEVVARTLETEQPEVVALQEVSQSWLLKRPNRAEVLAKRLGYALVKNSDVELGVS